MASISITAPAGLDIMARIMSGELEVHGVILRDAATKQFRYILRGLEHLPGDAATLGSLPPLQPLLQAVKVAQVLEMVSVAQNVAMAASLKRIESRLSVIEGRLSDIERRLSGLQTEQKLIIGAMRTSPVSRLKAAKTAAITAFQHRDRTALIAAGKDAQQAFHDLLEQARHLVAVTNNGVPVALGIPIELADLVESAADAAYVASVIWVALENRTAAAKVMREGSDGIRFIRARLAGALSDPELLLRRIAADTGRDSELHIAGRRLVATMHWSAGRAVMIEQGWIASDPDRISLERINSIDELSFVPVVETSDATMRAG